MAIFSWWSGQVSSGEPRSPGPRSATVQAQDEGRREVLEVLDRLVVYQRYYHSVYGHYTKLLSRLGYSAPASLSERYDVRVAEASQDRFLIVGFSERDGKTQDLVSIDQDFMVHANFELPAPRPEYLKLVALKHLRALREGQSAEISDEKGVFRGYFRYELARDSLDRKVAYAVGIRAPVLGMRLEAGEGEVESTDVLSDLIQQDGVKVGTGEMPPSAMSTLEEAYLAQKIFHGEVGRYARSWAELARIAKFRFEDKQRYVEAGQVPFGDDEPISVDQVGQEPAREPAASIDQDVEPLEIESLSFDAKK